MINKKISVLFVVFIFVLAVYSFLYFKYWQEPQGVYVETDNPELARIRENLDDLISGLEKKGLYNCCIRNDCKWCAIYMGHCPCAKMVSVEGNEKSCPECAAAWNKKQGKIPGVDPDAVKVTTFGIYGYEKGGHHHHHKEEHHH